MAIKVVAPPERGEREADRPRLVLRPKGRLIWGFWPPGCVLAGVTAWLGGAILASLEHFEGMWLTREAYDKGESREIIASMP